MSRIYGPGWEGDFGGCVPVQGEGAIDGWPFYFKARCRHWELAVAPPGGDAVDVACGFSAGWYVRRHYRRWPGVESQPAGYMEVGEVASVMLEAVASFRVWRASYERGEAGFPVCPQQRTPW